MVTYCTAVMVRSQVLYIFMLYSSNAHTRKECFTGRPDSDEDVAVICCVSWTSSVVLGFQLQNADLSAFTPKYIEMIADV